jgi:hypothetical protein
MDEHNRNRLNTILKQNGCDSPEHTAALFSQWILEYNNNTANAHQPLKPLFPVKKNNPLPRETASSLEEAP